LSLLYGFARRDSTMTKAEQRIVAIVDDDLAVRESLQFLTETTGFLVEIFASAEEFLQADIHGVACLILDHHMPNMTGLELAQKLRDDGLCVPILLITGAPSPGISARAHQLGINRVLAKPFDPDDLLDFVRATFQ
jgi:two-component system response regulator FixJ